MDIIKLSKIMHTIFYQEKLVEKQYKKLNDIFPYITKSNLEEIMNFPADKIPNDVDFTISDFIRLKSVINKTPFVDLIIKKMGSIDYIYNNTALMNLWDKKDIEFYLNIEPDFLNKKIKNGDKSVLLYIFESNLYTSLNESLSILQKNIDKVNKNTLKEIEDFLIKNKNSIIENTKHNLFFLTFLPDDIFYKFFNNIDKDKNKLFELFEMLPLSIIDSKLLNYLDENLPEDRPEGSDILKFFLKNEIPLDNKILEKILTFSDELKLPKLIEYENFTYLNKQKNLYSIMSKKYGVYGNKDTQDKFVEKILGLNFKIKDYGASLVFMKDIGTNLILSKKLIELKLIVDLIINKNFSLEQNFFIIKNIKELSFNEIIKSELFKEENIKYFSEVSKLGVTTYEMKKRVIMFKSHYEQFVLLNEVIGKKTDPKITTKKRI